MKSPFLFFTPLMLALLVGSMSLNANANADIVVDFGSNGVGGPIDDFVAGDFPSSPIAVDSVNAPGLDITFTSIVAPNGGDVLVTSSFLAILDPVDGSSFDPGESLSFQFNQAVMINSLDLASLDNGETLSFNGANYSWAASGVDPNFNTQNDIFTFAPPIFVAANTDITIAGVVGPFRLTNIDVSVVPEPASTIFLFAVGLCGLRRRR